MFKCWGGSRPRLQSLGGSLKDLASISRRFKKYVKLDAVNLFPEDCYMIPGWAIFPAPRFCSGSKGDQASATQNFDEFQIPIEPHKWPWQIKKSQKGLHRDDLPESAHASMIGEHLSVSGLLAGAFGE